MKSKMHMTFLSHCACSVIQMSGAVAKSKTETFDESFTYHTISMFVKILWKKDGVGIWVELKYNTNFTWVWIVFEKKQLLFTQSIMPHANWALNRLVQTTDHWL